jgi:hypothetical protein
MAQRSDSMYIHPTYTLKVSNLIKPQPNTIEFDVYMRHTNSDSTPFLYGAGQYFFTFNPSIANGGNLTYSTIASDLPISYVPVSASISGNILRLASNLPGPQSTAPTISSSGPGTRIVRMRLRTSATSFNQDSLLLRWRNAENPFTKVAAFTDKDNLILVEIQTPETHTIDSYTGIGESGNSTASMLPTEYSLAQNFPNPFNPSTRIDYSLPAQGNVKILIYDLAGREVVSLVNSVQAAGFYSVNFDGSNLASGMYFYRINIDGDNGNNFKATKRMVLIK